VFENRMLRKIFGHKRKSQEAGDMWIIKRFFTRY
jgi:hypothetical protein